ncbi:MAG: cytochrome c [Verrucomicrobiota bacterium]|nr:cytochrome c [Verrucomicrobiota bacterium]
MKTRRFLTSILVFGAGFCAAGSAASKREAQLMAEKQKAIAENPQIVGITKEIQIERGKKVFLSACFACHQADGKGLPGIYPPLAGSDFLKTDRERVIRIPITGLSGPITVNGKPFNNLMPPQQFTDGQIADVLTYVMNSWGNNFGAVSAADVKRVREQTQ